jgi:hypothetical protein
LNALLGALMATIVLPYRGHAAAARELKRPAGVLSANASSEASDDASGRRAVRPRGSGARIDFRPTYRTQMVLAAVAEHPGASNREVSVGAQVQDQGQISKLLARLEGLGLLQNTGGHSHGAPYAWHLTPRGEEVVSLSSHRGASVPSVSQEETVL